MVDRYQRLTSTGPGRAIARRLGLPRPTPLRRHRPDAPLIEGPVLIGPDGELTGTVREVVAAAGAEAVDDHPAPAALVFDATGIADVAGLRALHEFLGPRVRTLRPSGRILLLARPVPGDTGTGTEARIAQRALTGFARSLGKEVGRGCTVQLLRVAPGAPIGSSLRFFLSARSAYVSGQVIDIGAGPGAEPDDWATPLAGRTALVTGAAQGIGAAIAETLARDGARVVCLDVPAQGQALSAVANQVGGTSLQLDITAADAAATLAGHLTDRHDGVDLVVHNAGVLRDRTLARMSEAEWGTVLSVNLAAQYTLTRRLLDDDVLRPGGRIVCLSSLNGIAGAAGQTNYATSKAGVIGLVEALAPELRTREATINAVAPGFIETRMTASMPLTVREVGRRLNSLAQGGLPVDVAETVAWLAQPGSGGITGQVVRVCGQSLLGA
ncbi:MAG: 3-oxoacyl-ACP reductase [Actinocatenispora sp.]